MTTDLVLELSLSIRPQAKERPRLGRHAIFTPRRTKRFEEQLRLLMRSRLKGHPVSGPVVVEISFHFAIQKKKLWGLPHTKRPDLDNCLKSLMDAMNGTVFLDDAQVFHLTTSKAYAEKDRIDIKVYQLVESENVDQAS